MKDGRAGRDRIVLSLEGVVEERHETCQCEGRKSQQAPSMVKQLPALVLLLACIKTMKDDTFDYNYTQKCLVKG